MANPSPLPADEPALLAEVQPAAEPVVLVIDDEAVSRTLLRAHIQKLGYKAVAVSTAEEAIEVVATMPVDTIFCDIHLDGSDVDGIELAQKMFHHTDVPFIFVSGDDAPETIERIKMPNVAGYILKPIRKAEVLISLDFAHYKYKAEKALRDTNDRLNATLKKLGEAQSQLVQNEKMSSMGQLTTGIAHEINNPINFISACVRPLSRDLDIVFEVLGDYMLLHDLPESQREEHLAMILGMRAKLEFDELREEIAQLLDTITTGAQRTTEVVKILRNFTRADDGDVVSVDVNDCINSTIVLLNAQLGNTIFVTRHFGDIPPVPIRPGAINQVVMNILLNAVDAIRLHDAEGHIEIYTHYNRDLRSVVIAVEDSGPGISDEALQKAFEPFFTTKEVGSGSGLGLTIANSIVQSQGGAIVLRRLIARGTRVEIRLPIDQISDKRN